MPKSKQGAELAPAIFFAIVIVSFIGAWVTSTSGVTVIQFVVWLILVVFGATVSVLMVQSKEEVSFLIGSSSLLILIAIFVLIPDISSVMPQIVKSFLLNLAVAFGIASFIASLTLIGTISKD